jgi:aminopeptidase N
VDRTAGANPIRQDLANLKEAGSLYGAIIYKKAPIVMRMLETLIGEASFREGVQTYLEEFSHRNATWPDLIKIFDLSSSINLTEWSRSWVEEAGRPKIKVHLAQDDSGNISELRLQQSPPDSLRPQPVSLLIGKELLPASLDTPDLPVPEATGKSFPGFLLPNGAGRGYGEFTLDPSSQAYLVSHLPELHDPLLRGIAWLTLWDGMLEGTIPPGALFDLAIRALKFEEEELNVSRILHDLSTLYWRYLSVEDRVRYAPNLESFLLERIESSKTDSLKSGFFRTYRSVALSKEGVSKLREIYSGERKIPGVTFSESDQATTALELALRLPEESQGILLQQQESMKNPDRRRRLGFVSPALSPDPAIRERFFRSLHDPKNREHEPWVLEAITYLNHPIRSAESISFIPHALEWLETIQATGDIFFPKRWLDATLWGHQSKEAADLVRTFLESRPDYPERLRGKILQSADGLFRAATLLDR